MSHVCLSSLWQLGRTGISQIEEDFLGWQVVNNTASPLDRYCGLTIVQLLWVEGGHLTEPRAQLCCRGELAVTSTSLCCSSILTVRGWVTSSSHRGIRHGGKAHPRTVPYQEWDHHFRVLILSLDGLQHGLALREAACDCVGDGFKYKSEQEKAVLLGALVGR